LPESIGASGIAVEAAVELNATDDLATTGSNCHRYPWRRRLALAKGPERPLGGDLTRPEDEEDGFASQERFSNYSHRLIVSPTRPKVASVSATPARPA
jgi:hypothetical protein